MLLLNIALGLACVVIVIKIVCSGDNPPQSTAAMLATVFLVLVLVACKAWTAITVFAGTLEVLFAGFIALMWTACSKRE